MSEMNLNLLPSRAKFQATKILWKERVNKFMIGLAVLWLVLVGVIFGLKMWGNLRKTTAEKNLAKVVAEYGNYNDTVQNNQRLKYKAKLVGEVLSGRFEYSRAFQAAKEFFPEGVVMSNFNLDNKGGLKLEGTTTGSNLNKVEKLIGTINRGGSEVYSSAKITSLIWSEGFWKFIVEVGLK